MSDEKPSESDDACVVHDHPVPPAELARYSPERDASAESEIAEYVEWQSRKDGEKVQHVERIKTEYVMGTAYEIWDVSTDQNRWWVITNATNLYSQKYFPSLDYTLSFHIGLMMRMRSAPRRPDGENPQPFDEVTRRHSQADEMNDRAIEAVDFQGVGMQLRECMIALTGALRRRLKPKVEGEEPQAANFKAWNEVFLNELASGPSNKELRHFMKSDGDKVWQLVNWLTHDTKANKTASTIALLAVDRFIANSILLLEREQTDRKDTCPICSSRNLRRFFDAAIGEDGAYFLSCGECRWTDHPEPGFVIGAGEG